MSWSKKDDLSKYGIELTNNVKKLKLGNKLEDYQVYKIPLEKLRYNAKNGRIFMELNSLVVKEKLDINELEKNNVEEFNNEIETLIWESDVEKNEKTLANIEELGQLEEGVVLENGVVIDGNRRFTCLRKLHKIHPKDERFNFFTAAIVFRDENHISEKDIKRFELNVQFGQDEKADYRPINFNMSIYQLVSKEGWTPQLIAESTNKSLSEITKIIRTCKLVEDFLKHTQQEGQLYVAEKLNIYWPLEALGTYLNNKGSRLGDVEQERRKRLFFDYLIACPVTTPTQEFRENLINKIFSDSGLTNELINEYEGDDAKKVYKQLIDKDSTPEDFVENVQKFQKTETAKHINKTYKRKVDKKNLQNQANAPVELSDDVLNYVNQINIDPWIRSTSDLSDDKLRKIRASLSEAREKINDIINKIEEKIKN